MVRVPILSDSPSTHIPIAVSEDTAIGQEHPKDWRLRILRDNERRSEMDFDRPQDAIVQALDTLRIFTEAGVKVAVYVYNSQEELTIFDAAYSYSGYLPVTTRFPTTLTEESNE